MPANRQNVDIYGTHTCMDRTVRIQLHPDHEQAKALNETMAQFTQAFNQVCAYGWQNQEKNGVRLHHETCRDTKLSCPGLVSDLLIQARVKATETLTSAFIWKKRHEASYVITTPQLYSSANGSSKSIPW